MVIYDSIDSDNLMNAMSANLKNAKELFSRLTKGSAHLVEVVDSGVLSSAANTAGRDLFKTYIDPMIQNLSNAIDDIESDLTSYRTAEGMARQHESHLDEELLKKQLNATKNLIRLVQKKIDDDKDLIKNLQLAAHGNFSEIGDNLGNLPGLNAQLDNLEHSKNLYEQQIEALKTFESSTTTLFTDSLQAFKYALQGVDVINQTKASADGSISFAAGTKNTWLDNLKKQKYDSGYKNVDWSKVGKGLEDIKDLDKLKRVSELTAAYVGKTPKVKDSDKLKDFSAKKIVGKYGTFEFVKIKNEESILKGKQSFLSNSKKNLKRELHAGTNGGGSSTLIAWEPPKNTIFSKLLSSVNIGKQNIGYYNDIKNLGNTNVGFSAQEIAAEVNSKQVSFKLPIVGNKVTIGASAAFSLGASGHLTNTKEEGFSTDFKIGFGFGTGINLKIK